MTHDASAAAASDPGMSTAASFHASHEMARPVGFLCVPVEACSFAAGGPAGSFRLRRLARNLRESCGLTIFTGDLVCCDPSRSVKIKKHRSAGTRMRAKYKSCSMGTALFPPTHRLDGHFLQPIDFIKLTLGRQRMKIYLNSRQASPWPDPGHGYCAISCKLPLYLLDIKW